MKVLKYNLSKAKANFKKKNGRKTFVKPISFKTRSNPKNNKVDFNRKGNTLESNFELCFENEI